MSRPALPALLVLGACLLTALLYLPGLSGPWLLDDFQNLGPFLDHAPGAAPYHELVFSNGSGPLGRPVAMASFALNHALGLFSPAALKATNLVLHLLNGTLLFLLLRILFRHRAPTHKVAPDLLAALLAAWWLLLPLHLSTVLYIVQRMTLLAATFGFAALLAYAQGRLLLATRPRAAVALLALALLVLLPLALLAKESAATFVLALVLVELLCFRPARAPVALGGLGLLLLAGLVLVALWPPAALSHAYVGRDFTLPERLLSEPRALWAYARALLLPGPADVSVFHDDFAVSRTLLAPPATLAALAGLLAVALLALREARPGRLWAVALGIGLFLAGHVLESTAWPLELYFEHRNYWPAAGLLLALAVLALRYWPGERRHLALVAGLYLAVLAVLTLLQARTWGDEGRLLAAAARAHPQSVGAQAAWGEYLFERDPGQALRAVVGAAQAAPEVADVLFLQALSMHCRLGAEPSPALVRASAAALARPRIGARSVNIGLDDILQNKRAGRCGHADFTPLAPVLLAYDHHLVAHYGNFRGQAWPIRGALGDWLLELGHPRAAAALLGDVWQLGPRADMPRAGLAYAHALAALGDAAGARRVLDELAPLATDAPPDFQQEMNRVRHATQDRHD